LPGSATTPGEQQKAAVIEGQRTSIAITRQLAALDPFIEALRARITSALRLGQSRPEIGGSSTPTELRDLCFLTAAVGAEMPRAHELGTRLKTFVLLARSRGDDSNVAQVDETAAVLAGELRLIIARIQDRLKQFPYPFPHARGPLSVADYARYEQPPENEWDVYLDANAHVERLFSLNYRLLGRVLAFAHAVETRLSDPDGTKGDGSGAVNGATEAQETEQRSAIG
jgi:hypothetical protein